MSDGMGYDPDLDSLEVKEAVELIKKEAEKGLEIAKEQFSGKSHTVYSNILEIIERIKY